MGRKLLNTDKSRALAASARIVDTVLPRFPNVNGAGAVNWLVSNQRSIEGWSSAALTPVLSRRWLPPKQKQVLFATPQLYIGGPCESVRMAFTCQPPKADLASRCQFWPSGLPE